MEIETNKPQRLLQWSLFGGAIYFLLVSVAHMAGIKAPFLFVYFSGPSYLYQDRIISILSFGWAIFLFSGYKGVKDNVLEQVKYILFAGFGGIIGLCAINFSTDFDKLLTGVNVKIFWLETLILGVYFIWLIFCYQITIKSVTV